MIIKCMRSWPCIFWSLIGFFVPIYDSHLPKKSMQSIQLVATTSAGKRKGRPWHLDAAGCLGPVLMWYCTRGPVSRSLCIMFGLTLTTAMLQLLKFGKIVLLPIVQCHPDARIQKPSSAAKVLSYNTAISSQYHNVPDVWGACDGLKLPIQASLDDITHNMF